MKKPAIPVLSAGQALALALADAAQSCRELRTTLAQSQTAGRARRANRAQRLRKATQTLAALDKQIARASDLAKQLAPKRGEKADPDTRRRRERQAATAIEREVSAVSALAEEASGTSPSAALAGKVLAEREGSVRRRLQRLGARHGGRVRARAAAAEARVDVIVLENEERQGQQEQIKRTAQAV